MKQFHEKYQDEEKLDELIKKNKAKNWTGAAHHAWRASTGRRIPTCRRSIRGATRTEPPAEQFVFERNPFFHRVDENGLQLPYIDQFVLNVSSSSIIPAKTGAGESDLQVTGIDFADYTFLKDAEKRYPVKVRLWKRTQGSRVALLPNLNCGRRRSGGRCCRMCASAARCRWRSTGARSTWRCSTAWPRKAPTRCCRKARSSSRNTPKAWIAHDPDQANALLDEVGLTERDDDGIRLLPDGRPAQIIVEIGRRKHARDRRARTRHRPLAQDRHLRCSSARRSATCSAAARSAARS